MLTAETPTVLIQFTEATTAEERATAITSIQGVLVRWLAPIHVAEVQLLADSTSRRQDLANDPAAIAQQRWQATGRSRALITTIENNTVVTGTYLPNDPDVINQSRTYALQTTHTSAAWDYTRGDPSVIIAVLDSGINPQHPEFQDRLLPGYDVINQDNEPTDDHGHGTHTAGIIAAGIDNGIGMAGVCPGCSLLPVKVLNQNNAGTWAGVAEGILYATDNGARVINLSLGAAVSSITVESAIAYAAEHDVFIVAAAGNMGTERAFYPAALEHVVAVSATDAKDQRWVLSNYGAYIDVAAPGYAVYSTYYDLGNYYGGYTYMSGTSMAAPHVAGLAGLLLSQNADRSADELYQIITSTADKVSSLNFDPSFGYGRINAARALAYGVTPPDDVIVSEQPTPTNGQQQARMIYLPITVIP
ncbi:MAG: peptidase S8 [Caldilineaceae bacterium]|nr:peptidase S8 [Caldilineaceae bacterium]